MTSLGCRGEIDSKCTSGFHLPLSVSRVYLSQWNGLELMSLEERPRAFDERPLMGVPSRTCRRPEIGRPEPVKRIFVLVRETLSSGCTAERPRPSAGPGPTYFNREGIAKAFGDIGI